MIAEGLCCANILSRKESYLVWKSTFKITLFYVVFCFVFCLILDIDLSKSVSILATRQTPTMQNLKIVDWLKRLYTWKTAEKYMTKALVSQVVAYKEELTLICSLQSIAKQAITFICHGARDTTGHYCYQDCLKFVCSCPVLIIIVSLANIGYK